MGSLHIQGLEKPTQRAGRGRTVVGTGSDRKEQGFTYKLFLPNSLPLSSVGSRSIFRDYCCQISWQLDDQAFLYRKPKYYYKNNPLSKRVARQTSELPIMLLLWGWRLYYLSVSSAWFSVCLTSLVQPLLPPGASCPPPPVFILPISIHNAWRASHTITTYYCCPYSTQPALQAAALRGKKKIPKHSFSQSKGPQLEENSNQLTKHTTIIQLKNSETRNYLKPLLPTPKSNSHKVPLSEHICNTGISVPSLPACQPLQNVSIFRAWAAGSSQQHFPSPHPTRTPGDTTHQGLGLGLEMQS